MRVIQVGLGFWGLQWVHIVKANPKYELVGVVDPNRQALDETQADHGSPESLRFESLSRALEVVDADAVLIIAPAAVHASLALEALAAGKHVLCEKPMALTLDQAQEMAVAAEQSSCCLTIAQNYRYRPPALTARAVIESGRLGRVQSINVRFARDVVSIHDKEQSWRTQLAHPLLADMAIHHFDLMRFLLGTETERIYAQEWGITPHRPGAAGVTCILNMIDGTVITYTGDWFPRRAETSWNGDWYICGEKATLVWTGGHSDWNEAEMTLHFGMAVTDNVPLIRPEATDRAAVLVEFAAAVCEGREPLTSGQDNIRSLAIMLAAMESAESGQPVSVSVN